MSVRHIPYDIDEQADRHHFYETLWKQQALALLLQHCRPEGKTLLDYGCGRGESLALASQAGFKAQGTDVDPKCVELSNRFAPACLLNPADPLTQFGERSFDVVTCFHVLEHVENPRQTLSALGRIAREYVVLAVPNLRYLYWLFKRRIDLDYVNEGHLQSWDHWHLRNLAERHCGLKLVEWGTDATILPVLSPLSQKLLGSRATIWLERGPFRRLFPFHGVSVLGLFRRAD
jgi:SAM-dependent methyltransferase